MIRRRIVLASAGAAALAAGVGWRQWRERGAPAHGGAGPAAAATQIPWTLRFPRPGGGELVMAQLLGHRVVLNFWATWCPPCVKEMPDLDRFQREFAARGWRVAGLAVDNEPAVREFLRRQPVTYEIGLAGFEGASLARQLGNDRGGLPFTIVFDAGGTIRQRKIGETSYDELAGWAASG